MFLPDQLLFDYIYYSPIEEKFLETVDSVFLTTQIVPEYNERGKLIQNPEEFAYYIDLRDRNRILEIGVYSIYNCKK